MFSVTEERLRNFIEKLSEALTNEVKVEVRPGDSWAAYPTRTPPLLTFRLADVAVIKDEILSVTAHEIAHLLYTNPETEFTWDTGKYPKAAHLLLNAVEDSRIERVFADEFPGARSLFDSRVNEAYDGKVQREYEDLPIKWRFILNIDRVLHGLEPWGNDRDLKAIEGAFDHVIAAMWTDDTQECANLLEAPFRIMVELIKLEKDEDGTSIPQHLDIPPDVSQVSDDYMPNAPQDDSADGSGQVSDSAGPGADADDGQPGGTDGTDGKRQGGIGQGKGEGGKGTGQGTQGGKADGGDGYGDGSGAGTNKDFKGFGDPNNPDLPGDPSGGGGVSHDKATNIIEEMVAEERAAGSRNKTIDILSYRQRQRAQRAKEIEKAIELEKVNFWEELNKLFGQDGKANKRLAERLIQNKEKYDRDKASLTVEIRTLRGYARQILRDNQTDRYGGNHTSGRRIKTHRLYRMQNGDPRIFERKEDIGGKSYAICVVVDQSSSMRGGSKQELAYMSSLVFLEAFEGLAETSVVGFSEIGGDDAYVAGKMRRSYYARIEMQKNDLYNARTYKDHDADLNRRTMMVPELANSYNTTPMAEGIERALRELEKSEKDVKAMLIITDGLPNDAPAAKQALVKAKRAGIETYGLHIEGRTRNMDSAIIPPGLAFLGEACDRVVDVKTTAAIPQAVNRLLRGVVRRGRISA